MDYQQVTENVTLLQLAHGSNSACIALEDELIFIDSGMNTIVAQNFRKNMEKKYNLKSSTLILTHSHLDHFLGMGAFSDCRVAAAESAKPRFEKLVDFKFTKDMLDNFENLFPSFKVAFAIAKLSTPSIWIKEKKEFGKNSDILFQVLGGHSSCSSSIYYKPDKVMFVGDLIQPDVYPYFGEPDTDMNKWIEILRNWEQDDIDIILPGHGGILSRDYCTQVREYFEKLIENLSNLKKEGITEEELIKRKEFNEGYWSENAVRKPAYNNSIINLFRKL